MNNFLRRITTQNKPVTRKQYQYVCLRVRFFLSLSLRIQYSSISFETSRRISYIRFPSFETRKWMKLPKRGGKYNTYIYIYIHVSPPLFEYIGFEFWVWVNSMKTRPNRGTVCKLPIASFPQVFRAPVSDKYSTKDTLPLLPPCPCAQSITIGIYRACIDRVAFENA